MKLVLFAIIAFHFANFGEAQVSISPPLIPDYCKCANLWIDRTVINLGLPVEITAGELAKKIIKTRGKDDCFDKMTDLKKMFNVGHSKVTLFPYKLNLMLNTLMSRFQNLGLV